MHKKESFEVLCKEKSLITFWNKKFTISSGKYAKVEHLVGKWRENE